MTATKEAASHYAQLLAKRQQEAKAAREAAHQRRRENSHNSQTKA